MVACALDLFTESSHATTESRTAGRKLGGAALEGQACVQGPKPGD